MPVMDDKCLMQEPWHLAWSWLESLLPAGVPHQHLLSLQAEESGSDTTADVTNNGVWVGCNELAYADGVRQKLAAPWRLAYAFWHCLR